MFTSKSSWKSKVDAGNGKVFTEAQELVNARSQGNTAFRVCKSYLVALKVLPCGGFH